MRKLYILIGTRPNFIKVTRFKSLASNYNFEVKIIHTGQHFDDNMANVFFDQFDLRPDYFLEVGGMSPNSQVAHIILKLEELFTEIGTPDYFMVPGDVNSTLAGAITANKMGIDLIHLESGLRSFDKKMPEEHNRVVADNLSQLCLVTEPSGIENLENEHIQADVHLVGNTMIDTLVAFGSDIDKSNILNDLKLQEGKYTLCTFHRPSNVDAKAQLGKLVELLNGMGEMKPVVVPLHPRTKKMMLEFNLLNKIDSNKVIITDPLGYFEFQKLIKHSAVVVTDSGGIQEETTYRMVPCLTVRNNTERPITITQGTNTLMNFDIDEILNQMKMVFDGDYKTGSIPKFWDGKTSERIFEILQK